jgi:hypothetical protein
MNWNWEPGSWKKSSKVWLALATIWPLVYIPLFVITIFSVILLIPSGEPHTNRKTEDIDLLQLDRKIRNGEIKELIIAGSDVRAVDRVSDVEYRTYVPAESTRQEIIKTAGEPGEDGKPHVFRIEEKANPPGPAVSPLFPIGFIGLFAVHMITILLMLLLMPFYIVLVVKSSRLDETMRIVWVVLICLLGMFAMPVYWYLYVWRAGSSSATVANPS